MKWFLAILTIVVSIALASCGSTTAPVTYTIGGTVSGLSGTGLVLQNNGGDNLAIASNGAFTFVTAIVTGNPYNVTVVTQPTNPVQTCAVTFGGTGVATTDVVIVQVVCTTNSFSVGGTVSGLSGTNLVLQIGGGNNLAIGANGSFIFSNAVSRGSSYNVTVLTQPSGPVQTCNVTNGYGASITGNVTNIQVACFNTAVTYTIGGMVSGLSGKGLVLQDNSGDNLSVSASGGFTFPTAIAKGSTYSVTVLAQPSSPSQNCVVTGGGGTASANITGIQVTCTTVLFNIGGTITGLTGSGLVLQNNGGNNLPVSANASSFTFGAQVPSGATYAVTVLSQPSGPSCSITGSSGTVTNINIDTVVINCTGNTFNISATVSGLLSGTSVVLQDNAADNLTISSNGITTNFNTAIATGSAYAVTVLTQPAGATCTVGSNASGKVASANINVAVTCGTTITAGVAHTCALTSGGGVLCWGSNEFGQLGNGDTANSTTPVSVVGLTSGVNSIAAGGDSTCALTTGGNVWCWGDNATGQLGNGTFAQSSVPVQVMDPTGHTPIGGVATITVGLSHACAVTGAGAALCWGDNAQGELGNGNELGSNVPGPVSGLTNGVATISAGSEFTCAVTTSGQALCWGRGDSGQLGSGTATSSKTPVPVFDSSDNAALNGVVTVSTGFQNACALMDGGTVLCWGVNESGQLGNGTSGGQSNTGSEVVNSTENGLLSGVVAIAVGQSHTCALTGMGTALCWGSNAEGQLGTGKTSNSTLPVEVSGPANGIAAVSAGSEHACAVTNLGAAQCWGANLDGQLGTGSTAASPTPTMALGEGGNGILRLN